MENNDKQRESEEKELNEFLSNIPEISKNQTWKRELNSRIFVNRDLRLDKIKWVGFDMDYTLASYNSPQYESLTYSLMLEYLVSMGYPNELSSLKYDPEFAIRGIYFDKVIGTLIKVDSFGSIVSCYLGRREMSKTEISQNYPSFTVPTQDIEKRYWPLPSLFNLPEACLYADLIDFFFNKKSSPSQSSQRLTLRASRNDIVTPNFDSSPTIVNLFQDVRLAMDHVHLRGILKQKTMEDMSKYIKKDERIGILLDRLGKSGIKSFLLTNSEPYYTDAVMTYLLEGEKMVEGYTSWRDFFDVIIVSAGKPSFFSQGTTLREVDVKTGHLKVTKIESFEKGHVYQGGSIGLFNSLTGIRGNEVLYVGDHIYADIIKSKKIHAWRTLLVIPELEKELHVWQQNKGLVSQLKKLEWMKAEVYRNLDSESTSPPDTTQLRKHMKNVVKRLDKSFNPNFGSLFSSGSKSTQFAMQVMRYADLYSYDFLNLLNYPLFYHFTAEYHALPHLLYNETI